MINDIDGGEDQSLIIVVAKDSGEAGGGCSKE